MKLEIMRACEEWQRAGAYSVRIQGMNRQHHISLREEFDKYDGEGTRYVVVLNEGYPIGTCRFFETEQDRVTLGRVVVLPEYRGKHIGRLVVSEAEKWISELGYGIVEIESRTVAVGFYEKLGYKQAGNNIVKSGVFDCVHMIKQLTAQIKPET